VDNKIPKKIYLRWYDEDGVPYEEGSEEVTWCEDIVYADDVEYILATEIERLRKGNDEYVKQYNRRFGEHMKEVIQLRKEKEWLVENYAKTLYAQMGVYTKKAYNAIVIDAMQQALKEE